MLFFIFFSPFCHIPLSYLKASSFIVMKGSPIRIVAGAYKGKKGWINLEKTCSSENSTAVLVKVSKDKIKATSIRNTSFEIDQNKEPTCYAEAVLKECPNIESSLVTICRQLAQCDISQDTGGMMKVFKKMLDDAIEFQTNKGSSALYRRIAYSSSKKRHTISQA